jgi:hypothetical protein
MTSTAEAATMVTRHFRLDELESVVLFSTGI